MLFSEGEQESDPNAYWPPGNSGRAIHMMHMPVSGKILFWGYRQEDTDDFISYLWDPASGAAQTESDFEAMEPLVWSEDDPNDLICAGQTFAKDGRVIVVGGNWRFDEPFDVAQKTCYSFDPLGSSSAWDNLHDIVSPRYYPSITRMPDGRLVNIGGAIQRDPLLFNRVVPFEQSSDPSDENTWFAYAEQQNTGIDNYPFVFPMSNADVFIAGPASSDGNINLASYKMTASGTGFAFLGGNAGFMAGSAVMYAPGKILKCGGRATAEHGDDTAVNDSAIIDLNAATPAWTSTPDMAYERLDHNLVILPTGDVLALAGGESHKDGSTDDPVFTTELYKPASNTWTTLASSATSDRRAYHSIGGLLMDARVVLGGGTSEEHATRSSAQIFNPPYLFKENGQLAPRPSITSGTPTTVNFGATFDVSTATNGGSGIARFTLLGLNATTHGYDMNQRFIELSFQAGIGGSYTITAPANGVVAPPGYYLLFAINGGGTHSGSAYNPVPSIGQYIKVQ